MRRAFAHKVDTARRVARAGGGRDCRSVSRLAFGGSSRPPRPAPRHPRGIIPRTHPGAPAMPRKKLPIGIQTFREIREDNCYYVDKT
ncbi:MAG: hypothetical protein LBF91_06240, partial [Azoarcus sp.]|nr:hypothetical protein [Azoarcus sp.]